MEMIALFAKIISEKNSSLPKKGGDQKNIFVFRSGKCLRAGIGKGTDVENLRGKFFCVEALERIY